MATAFFTNKQAFNQSVLNAYSTDRWKFLEEMDRGLETGVLLRSPMPILGFTVGYVLFVCFIGPFMMRNREPFQLKSLIRFYNLLMVFLAGILFLRLYDAMGSLGAMVDCKKVFNVRDESGTKVYQMANFILSVRLSEYLDTIFFTLRKKPNQITFLHVFHHAFVPMYAYWVLRTAPLRFNVYILLINSLVHVLMYFYYYLATFQQSRDPSNKGKEKKPGFVMLIVQKLLMFKKYMTQLQILQFVTLGLYAIWAAVQPNQCGVPWTYIIANFLLAFGFLSMFLHFYLKMYKAAAAKARRD